MREALKIEAGQRYGNLTTLYSIKRKNGPYCRCDCGQETVAFSSHLRAGMRVSCGCLVGKANLKHGMSHSSEYKAWDQAKARCYNKNNKKYPLYGARGIKMCQRWRDSFSNFLEDMGKKPSSLHSLDRIDGDGDYEPQNCRWATDGEQNNNRPSFNRYVTLDGVKVTVAEAARATGIPHATILSRLDAGKTDTEALNAKKYGRVDCQT